MRRMLREWCRELRAAFVAEFKAEGCLNKTALLLLVCLPLIYTILLGAAYSANVLNDIPMVVCDLQQSKISRQVVSNYDTSDRFTVVKHVGTQEELLRAIENGEAKVGLYIEPDLDKNIKTAKPAEIGIYIEASNMVYGSASLVASEEINLNLLVSGSQRILERMTYYPDRALRTAYPATYGVRILNNPTHGYCNFMLLGLICNGVQISLFLYAADIFFKNRRKDWRFKSALLLGKLLAIEVISGLAFSLSILLAQELFAVPLRGAWYEFLALEAAFIFFFAGLGMMLSLAFPNPILMIQESLLFIMPGMLYSGLSWPNEWLSTLPAYIRVIFPITYLAMPMRDLSLLGWSDLLVKNIGILAGAGLVCFIAAYLLLRHRAWQEVEV